MTTQDVILIHGTWGNGTGWGPFAEALEERGFRVHAPTARYHGDPKDVDIWSNAQKIAKLGLLDYIADLQALADTLETPPLIIGHSLGGLLAQMLGNRVDHRGLILLGTAPAWGFQNLDLKPTLLWARYLPQWIGGKPMYPVSKDVWDDYICNRTPREISDPFYDTLCAESGTAYRQMVMWYLDRKRQAKVDYHLSDTPVLIIVGEDDKCTVPRISRLTARKYGHRATYVEIPDADHMVTVGAAKPLTFKAIDEWIARHELSPATAG
jgi:pimeloyl-ACP methyl ester carboxylesterase